MNKKNGHYYIIEYNNIITVGTYCEKIIHIDEKEYVQEFYNISDKTTPLGEMVLRHEYVKAKKYLGSYETLKNNNQQLFTNILNFLNTSKIKDFSFYNIAQMYAKITYEEKNIQEAYKENIADNYAINQMLYH